MRAPHDVQTVSGSHVSTVADGPAADATGGPGLPVGPQTAGMIGREILGQYRVVSKLGRGGMGTVFLAQQMGMNRQVAVKVLHPEVSSNPDAARRFQLEAQAAARLSSPNIVSVFNFGQLDTGELYLAMEFLQGRTLHAEIATYGQLPLPRVVELVRQIGRGLDEAHRNGVIHRDLKPGNVMLAHHTDGEVAKLLDFGIAKLDTGTSTQTQGWVGTPRYMAPEQFTGSAIDARTDVYALGLITYEMLCGRPPFVSDNPMSYVHNHVYAAVPTMQSVAPGVVPPAVEAVVLSALAKDPRDRPPSAGAFAEELSRALHAPAPVRPKRTPVGAIVGAAAVAVLVLSGGVAFAYHRFWDDAPAAEVEAARKSAELVKTPVAHVPASPVQEFDPEYLAQVPKEFRGLVELDEDTLLEKLEELIEVYPPSSREQAMATYTLQLAAMPGAERGLERRVMLINGIIAMSKAANYMPQDSRTTDELLEDYLSRPGPIPKDMRQEIVDNMRENVLQPEDADWTIRQWLLQMEIHDKKQAAK